MPVWLAPVGCAGPPSPGLTIGEGRLRTILNKRAARVIPLGILILLTLGFIWGNSAISVPESKAVSMGLLERLRPILDAVFGPGRITDHVLRKTAHFAEFFLLGAELRLLFLFLGGRGIQGTANALFAGLAAAVTDEYIQLFSLRGSQVSDVVLDFSGVFTGAVLLALLAFLIRRPRG